MKTILSNILFYFFRSVAWLLSCTFFSLKVEGRGNLPEGAPFIVVANHTSYLDPMVMQVAVPPRISWIAKKDVCEKWYLKLVHYVCGSIPVNGSVKCALEALDQKRILGIFPEGVRSHDGRLKEAGKGIAVLALKSGAPIVPVGIKGAFEAYPPGRLFFRPRHVSVKIGSAFFFDKIADDPIDEETISNARSYVMKKIGELL